jgi:hypothetical protein
MRDPVERMVSFVEQQKRIAAAEHARAVWADRLGSLRGIVEEVVEVFRRGLEEPAALPIVSVFVEPKNDQWPLVVLFAEREGETGASAVFRCRDDGVVCGLRYPFHDVGRTPRPEQFADLGEPGMVAGRRLGNAVADFLEWASVGEGCGARRLRFWSPLVPQGVVPQPVKLALVMTERDAA